MRSVVDGRPEESEQAVNLRFWGSCVGEERANLGCPHRPDASLDKRNTLYSAEKAVGRRTGESAVWADSGPPRAPPRLPCYPTGTHRCPGLRRCPQTPRSPLGGPVVRFEGRSLVAPHTPAHILHPGPDGGAARYAAASWPGCAFWVRVLPPGRPGPLCGHAGQWYW